MNMMNHRSNCKCPHHSIHMLVMILGVVAAVGFWIATLMHGSFLGISATHYFKEVIVLGILAMGMGKGLCQCCCGGCGMCVDKGMMNGMENKQM